MSEPRTVTLPTRDAGEVTLPEPSWCTGHADHRPDAYRADLTHYGPRVDFTLCGRTIGFAQLAQAPCSERASRAVEMDVALSYEPVGGLTPAGLYDLAADMDTHADRLRDLAAQLDALLAGGGQ
ncbi:DUF6907 domain-containing protein [Streptomyces sp. NPDC060006]|uniref:DUF6907 domain-containing protein n=1 Tax=unclassified Streptomyces TaxID=2593676 RepID=UPI0036CF9400